MNRIRTMRVVALAIVAFAMNAAGAQTILRVKADAPSSGDGASWGTAYNTLQGALATATAGTEIWVAEGTYTSATGVYAFEMKSNVAVYGGFAGSEEQRNQRKPRDHVAILSGSHARTVVGFVSVSSATLDGFRITAGLGHGDVTTPIDAASNICPGGGMVIQASTVQVSNCDFQANSGGPYRVGAGNWPVSNGDGGGAVAINSNAHFADCTFVDGRVGFGYFDGCGGGTPFIYGGAGSGGGIASQNSQLFIDRCTFDSNWASGGIGGIACSAVTSNGANGGSGGAINAVGGSVQVSSSRFLRNFSGSGGSAGLFHGFCNSSPGTPGNGGAIATSGTISVTNTAFVGNGTRTNGPTCGANAGGQGAAIRSATSATISNCLFYGNFAPGNAGTGLGTLAVPTGSHITNCVFWANTGDSGQTQVMQLGNVPSTSLQRCIVQNLSPVSGTNRAVNPLFLDPLGPDGILGTADDRFDLAIGSPAIDAGDNAAAAGLTLDLAGNPRFFDVPSVPDTGAGTAPIIDIGPHEFSRCPIDLDNGSGTGTSDNAITIDDLLYFITAFESGAPAADLDNGTAAGVHDHSVTIDDLLFFLAHFEAGC